MKILGTRGNVLVIEKYNIPVRTNDLQTLKPGAWLNDEVINFYFGMVMERAENESYPSCFAHQTIFYTTLENRGYSAVRRWTRRVDIFAKDVILIPVHLSVHWTIVVVDMKNKTVEFFDSMGAKR
jgi:Ulp1 family protease